MNVVIFTEDTAVKLPPIDKWRGIDITEDSQIMSLLERHNLAIPHDDIELENRYREVLHKLIRPARSMFAGMFSEVRTYANTLSEFVQTDLCIISGRYDLLQENDEILPYSYHLRIEQDLEILDEKTDFSSLMIDAAKKHGIIIMLLPKHYLTYLLKRGWFNHLDDKSHVFIVSSKKLLSEFSNYNNVSVLQRKGVARLGEENRNEILKIIKNQLEIYIKTNEVSI